MSFATQNGGVTVFHSAANFNRIEVFQGIFNLAKNNITIRDVKELYLATGNKGWKFFLRQQYSKELAYFREYLIQLKRI